MIEGDAGATAMGFLFRAQHNAARRHTPAVSKFRDRIDSFVERTKTAPWIAIWPIEMGGEPFAIGPTPAAVALLKEARELGLMEGLDQ